MNRRDPTVVLRSRAWVPDSYVKNHVLEAFSYQTTTRVQDEETGEWEEQDVDIELPVWNSSGSHVGLPRGDLSKVLAPWPRAKVVDQRVAPPLGFPLHVMPHVYADERWPAQQRLLKLWLRRRGGVVKSPPASGKSVLALAILAELGLTTLVLFDRKDFCRQWYNELHEHTTIKRAEQAAGHPLSGIFQGTEIWPITFTTFQRLISKRGRRFMQSQRNAFGLVVVDECHHASAKGLRSVASFFNPLTYLGVTATPERKDKLEGIYSDFLGPLAVESDADQLVPIVRLIPTGFEVSTNPYLPEFAQWNHFLNQITKNVARNKMICNDVVTDVDDGRCILVVSERVKHCLELKRLLTARTGKYGLAPSRVAIAIGGTGNRDQIYRDVDDGKVDVLIASKLIDEGVNIPRLDTLSLATPLASKPRIEQRVGRTQRPVPGKKRPLVRDYVDRGHGMIYGSARARENVYKKIGATIKRERDTLDQLTGLKRWRK